MSWLILIPKCPARMPVKNTKVTPSDIPHILILDRARPTAHIMHSTRIAWVNVCSVNMLLIQSITSPPADCRPPSIKEISRDSAGDNDQNRIGLHGKRDEKCREEQHPAGPVDKIVRSHEDNGGSTYKPYDCRPQP